MRLGIVAGVDADVGALSGTYECIVSRGRGETSENAIRITAKEQADIRHPCSSALLHEWFVPGLPVSYAYLD